MLTGAPPEPPWNPMPASTSEQDDAQQIPTHALRDPFLDRAHRYPEENWAICPLADGGEVQSRNRGASAEIIARTEAGLMELGLRPGTLVGILSPPGPAFVETLVAAWGAGLCPVLLDPTTTEMEREQLEIRLGMAWRWDLPTGWMSNLGQPRPAGGAGGDSPVPGAAVLKLTSGSTGPARGIAVSARALAADTTRLIEAMGLTQADRLLAAVPLTHSYGFSVLTAPALMCGATLCFPGALDVLEAGWQLGATFLPSVPSWYRAMLAISKPGDFPASLRLLLAAGAPLQPETARGFREDMGLPICVLYGASECGGIAYDGDGTATERGSVGNLLPGVHVDLGQPHGGGGRPVTVRSSAVAEGYIPTDDEDVMRLDGARYVSEDLARLEQDELFLMGRTSGWISVRAKKVNPMEVEAVIATLPGVDEVVVHGVPARHRGSETVLGEEQVRAVVACAQASLSTRDVLRWCSTRLAPHKRPRAVVLVDALPRTERGKIDRDRLGSLVPDSTARLAIDKGTSGGT
ncbi:MAG: long-chain acyl-CoA synthetase [Planctomycetota bacterium]|jgi:long-chain acyl-CoA synthetase